MTKIRNPLIKRIPREFIDEWHKYLVVGLFLILTIGFISGMYVANISMMSSSEEGKVKYNLEDGHFELNKKVSDDVLSAIATGEKADIHKYFMDKAKKELDEKFDDEFKKEFDSKFKEEFDKEFNAKFPSEFNKEFKKQFNKNFNSEFNRGFEKQFKPGFEKQFEVQVYDGLIAQGLDEETAKIALPDAVSEAKSNGTYKSAYDSAFKQAKKSSDYSSAYKKAYKSAYDKAYKPAYKKAYNTGYSKAYNEAYPTAYKEAYDEAYDEAWKEVQDEVEEEYAKVVDKYELDNADALVVPVRIFENFFRNADEDIDSDGNADGTVRVFKQTDYINQACLMEGSFPTSENEIAIDRMHANNAGIEVGDEISIGGETFEVSGLIAYVNYSTLHEKNSDLMFDAIKFDVAMVTEGGFDRIDVPVHYSYAWKYEKKSADKSEEKTQSENFLKALITQAAVADSEIEDFIPRYANSAVNFAPDDMGSDMSMGGVLLYILIVIIAFIFAVTISNTIQKEASVIGTLRASGYTKGELIKHYLATPVAVTFVAAIVGNVLGYTLFKNVVIGMYYNSYSLPTYETLWSSTAFLKTTVIPVILMFIINLAVIIYRMQLSPLKFLRHDLKRRHPKKAIRLPNLRFTARFRMRIVMQNIPNFIILFIGVYFVAVMLAMAVGMPSTLDKYKANASDMMFADYQYVLTGCEDEDGEIISTKNDLAEKFAMKSLIYPASEDRNEDISIYGIVADSKYVQIDGFENLKANESFISSSFADKFGLKVGDSFTLDDEYENEHHTFKIVGTYDNSFSLSAFIPLDNYKTEFDLDKNEFTGFLSDSEITDIDSDYIGAVIDQTSVTKVTDQLNHSMGSYMTYFQYLCVILSAVLIYLLTKLIIEKNEVSISMIKILGYTDADIFRLYILSTTIVVILSDFFGVILGGKTMTLVWSLIMQDMNGWFEFSMSPIDYAKMFVYILAGYLIVLFFDFRRIKKIPMDQALKNVE